MMGGLNWSDGLRGKHCCHRINLHLPEINTNTPSRRGFLGIRAFYIPMITWWLVFGLARNFNVFLPSVNGSEENWGKSQRSRNHCSVTADRPVTFFPTSDSQSNMGSWVNMDLADLLECSICLEQVHNILNCILWCAKKILFCHVYDLKTKL